MSDETKLATCNMQIHTAEALNDRGVWVCALVGLDGERIEDGSAAAYTTGSSKEAAQAAMQAVVTRILEGRYEQDVT